MTIAPIAPTAILPNLPVDPDTPHIMGGNGGIVPPWLEFPITLPVEPEDEFIPLPGPDAEEG